MVFRFFEGKGGQHLENIEAKVHEMLSHDRRQLELAMAALVGEVAAGDVKEELHSADQKVNQLEREIRRELVVHASVFGGIQSPAVLVYMSIVKDIERVGDYAKNLLDLALEGASFGELHDASAWRELAIQLAEFIVDTGAAFEARDSSRCGPLLEQGDEMLKRFDERVAALVREDDRESQAVARALAYRYLKRVVAHLMNVLSSVVMPLDQLDSFDEDPEDRIG